MFAIKQGNKNYKFILPAFFTHLLFHYLKCSHHSHIFHLIFLMVVESGTIVEVLTPSPEIIILSISPVIKIV